VFVLFLDTKHVQIAGSYRAQAPITRLLNRVIGQDDMVGVMTPEMSARNLTLARRTGTIEGILKENWHWGERDQIVRNDPREQEIEQCYPDMGPTYGIAGAMISRRREGRTLDALEDLIIHLEGIREERKFVVLLSEGWLLRGRDPQLARPLETPGGGRQIPGGPTPLGTGPDGRLAIDPNRGSGSMASCERERSLLAQEDHASRFLELLQRANRANVSFYPVDARGMVVFDEPDVNRIDVPPFADGERLRARGESLRTLALNTDGFAIVGTNAIDKALERMVEDTGAYYLLGYYSTNTRLDGRFRKLTVRVKRKGADVRARPGYLAPTEAEAAVARRGNEPGAVAKPLIPKGTLNSVASRRGPSTGLQYVPSADARYRRTERIRLEVPRGSGEGPATARLLGRDGQAINVSVALSERIDPATEQRLIVADLPLAPLAQGDYVLEVALTQGDKTESATYTFRVIP
jgi:VWFA-related protein